MSKSTSVFWIEKPTWTASTIFLPGKTQKSDCELTRAPTQVNGI